MTLLIGEGPDELTWGLGLPAIGFRRGGVLHGEETLGLLRGPLSAIHQIGWQGKAIRELPRVYTRNIRPSGPQKDRKASPSTVSTFNHRFSLTQLSTFGQVGQSAG